MPLPEGRVRGGRWLAAERKSRGIQQGTLAHRLGISQQSLSGYENGRAWVPDDVAARIAGLFDLPESTVRRGLGLHVPGDIEVDVEAIGTSPEIPGEVFRLPPGVQLTALERKAIRAVIDLILEQRRAGGDPGPDVSFPGVDVELDPDLRPAASDL